MYRIVNQFITVARHTYDPKNGLYRHACDVSRKERWADPVTGQSQHSWGRAMGWYAMAFVDALDFIPKHEAGRDSMLVILNNIAAQVKRIQDPKTGLWYQVLDKSGEKGNYLESSCSTMFVYALFKAVRKGYIDKSYLKVALKGYQGILDNFIEVDKDGVVTITKACAVAGLGGKNYRMGDYTYYINETIRSNDPKAVGPFIMASLEWERLQQVKEIFRCDRLRYTTPHIPSIQRVAVCGGAGASFFKQALARQADIYISGDFKYHDFFLTENRIMIADIGHYESEQFTKEIFYEILTKKISKFAVQFSEINTNPIKYL